MRPPDNSVAWRDPTVSFTGDDATVIHDSLSDPEQFGMLVRRHAPAIRRYVTRRIGAEAADDVVAETFLVAFRQRAGYADDGRDCLPWLYGIATRLFDAIYNLLANGEPLGAVIPPKLSAALYRILRQLPGVHFESGTDLAGRKGLGFYVVLEGYFKEELMIDPLTYRYMGYKDVATTDHTDNATDGTRYIKKGQVLGWEALLGSAIVKHPGELP